MQAFINTIAPFALTIFVVGLGMRFGRWARKAAFRQRLRGMTRDFASGAAPLGLLQSLRLVLLSPITRFAGRANRTWARGYLFYHLAIITKGIGYSLAGLIVLWHVLQHNPVPDVAAHSAASYNYSAANLLALVFGNGESLQSTFLFGELAQLFVTVTWVAVLFAVAGNLHLLYTAVRRRNGAVLAGIDPAAADVRTRGWLLWDRVAVRLLIFCIIWTELLARLHVVDGIVFGHALLGLLLLTILPFTYLFHMVYNFLAVFYAVRRWRNRAIA